jgi:hypothetical protein
VKSSNGGDGKLGDSIPIHQGSGICLHRKAVAIPVGEQPNLLQFVSCHRIRPPNTACCTVARLTLLITSKYGVKEN